MNKTKRAIILKRINLVRLMASQIQPFEADMKWLNRWYVENAKTPLQVGNEVKQLKKSKLNKVYYRINDYCSLLEYNYGNSWLVKFPMVLFICDLNVDVAERSYRKFTDAYKPVIQTMNVVKHYFAKRCNVCNTLYWKKEITSDQFDNFAGNDNIACSFEHNAWTGEILSCCEDCANDTQKPDPEVRDFYNNWVAG